MPTDTLSAVVIFVIFIYSVVLHELAHGFAARSMGDHTAEHLGRLTLNPLKHLDMVGSVFLPLILYLAGSPFLFGYAKPVPYNPHNLNDHRWGPAKVAVAGPLTNIVLAVLFGISVRVLQTSVSSTALDFLSYGVMINIGLALFNLIPIPPLDGHWIAGTFFPAAMRSLYRFQWVLLALAIFVVFPALYPLLGFLFHVLTGR